MEELDELNFTKNRGIIPPPPTTPRPPSKKIIHFVPTPPKERNKNIKLTKKERAQLALQKASDESLHNRAILIVFAVSLLWMTNLGFVYFVVNDVYLPRPSLNDIGAQVGKSFERIEEQKLAYESCGSGTVNGCSASFTSESTVELQRTDAIEAINKANIEDNRALRIEALSQINASMNELQALVQTNVIDLENFQTDSLTSCPTIERWIAGQISAATAFNLVDQFSANTSTLLASRAEQLEARRLYDEEYLVNKTIQLQKLKEDFVAVVNDPEAALRAVEQELADFQACFTLTGVVGNATCPAPQGPIVGNTQGTLDEFTARFTDWDVAFEAYFNQSLNQIDTINDFIALIDDYNNGPFGLIQVSLDEPNDPSTEAAPFRAVIDGLAFLGVDESDTLAFLANARDTLSLSGDAAGSGAADAAATSDQLLDDFWADYNPPNITTDEAQDAWEEEKARLNTLLADILETFAAPDDTDADRFEEPITSTTILPSSPEDIINNTPLREFDFFLYPQEVLQALTVNLDAFVDYLFLFDILFRILHTLFIIRKYWLLSSIGKPPGDARIHRVAGGKFGIHETFDQKVARWLTHPFVLVGVGAIFFLLIGLTFWLIYEPIYEQYVDTCIRSERLDFLSGTNTITNGTMIYRNALSLSVNFAFSSGDNIIQNGVTELNAQIDSDCRTQAFVTTQTFNNDASLNFAIQQDYNASFNLNDELRTCLDVQLIDDTIGTDFVNQSFDDIWFEEFKGVTSSIYNCSNIKFCPVTCTGPALTIITSEVYTSSCFAEWWVHSSFLGILMFIFTFICVNISRIELVNAVVRIWWRALAPDEFSYYGTCLEDGTIVYPESVTEEGMYFREAVKKAVDLRIQSWERSAYVYVVYALVINVPWIYLLISFSRDLTFTQGIN